MQKSFRKIFIFSLLIILLSGCKHEVYYQGYIEGLYTYISAEVSGKVETLNVQRGQEVKKGQLLFTLSPQPELAELQSARASLREAEDNLADLNKGERPSELAAIEAKIKQIKAQLIYAEKSLHRYTQLAKQDYTSKDIYDDWLSRYGDLKQQLVEQQEELITAKLAARSDLIKAAEAKVNVAKAELQQAKWEFSEKKIISPISGLVFDILARVGDTIAANNPVVSMLAAKNIKIIFFVPEPVLNNISLGQQVTVIQGNKHYIAQISFISPEVEYTPPVIYSREHMDDLVYRIEARVSPSLAETLHPGQPVRVELANHEPNHAD